MCPDCYEPLHKKDFRGVQVDACKECAGIYFDDGEITDLSGTGRDAFSTLDAEVVPSFESINKEETLMRSCPGCGTAMHTYRYLYHSAVVLDECGVWGGMWVEDGELRGMEIALADASKNDCVKLAELERHQQMVGMRVAKLQRLFRLG